MLFWNLEKLDRRALFSHWLISRVRWIASTVGAYSSICALGTILLAVAALLTVSLIPLFLSEHGDEALGELYCINNYSLIAGFEIPQYSTTFTLTTTSKSYTISGSSTNNYNCGGGGSGGIGCGCGGSCGCVGGVCTSISVTITSTESVSTVDTCNVRLLSIVYPNTPNGTVFDNYALSEACYRTLQTCSYDPLLTSCLLSNCVAVAVVDSFINASYPLTNYRLLCTAKIYYKTRCLDSPASSGLYYSSSQKNSACRQQRLNRINTCLNSTVQLLNVPCLISVSSGRVTNESATCTQTLTTNPIGLTFAGSVTDTSALTTSTATQVSTMTYTFSSETFSASDQNDGHVYRISSVNSETYNSSQLGALYCGAATHTQIASSITAAINSQN